jgi:intracellular septation protein
MRKIRTVLTKFFIENGAIITFFLSYKLGGHNIKFATGVMIITAITATIAGFFLGQKPSVVSYLSTILLTVMGSLSILSGDSRFIKMKPTMINSLFAVTLLGGCYYGKGLAKHLFKGAIEMSEKNWIKFSFRFGVYFATLAVINEIIWRNYSEETWVNFKLFGMLPLSILFMFTQVPFLLRNNIIPPE